MHPAFFYRSALIKRAAAEKLLAESILLYKLAGELYREEVEALLKSIGISPETVKYHPRPGELYWEEVAPVIHPRPQEVLSVEQEIAELPKTVGKIERSIPVTTEQIGRLRRLIRSRAFLPAVVGLGALGLGLGGGYLFSRRRG
jgi:integrase